jgi:hypothetical protein
MFDDLMGAYGNRFFIAAGGVAIGLLLLVAILWIMRNRAPSPFVRGGRNRQPRLQVLDAAAVDARRRLVLVRRDDVEHLIMIGGPSDIVIESRILPIDASEPERAPERPPAPSPAPSPAPAKQEPAVMVAEMEPMPEPVAQPAARPLTTRGLSPIEEFAPAPEPFEIQPVAPPPVPQPAPRQPTFEVEIERAQPPAPVEFRPQPPVVLHQEPARIETAAAADILDSARQRVLSPQRIEPQVMSPPITQAPNFYPAAPQPAPAAPQRPAPSAQPSDFQRVLEEEMSTNFAMEQRIVQQPSAPVRPAPTNMPRRDPEMAPMTGADAALQNEVARIFGEMSVNRDK